MNKDYFLAAEIINQAYDVSSTFDENKKYDFMFIYDDDITTVLKSTEVYQKAIKQNPNLKVVMVGGEGLLATAFSVMRLSLKVRGKKELLSQLKKESEAQRLARVAIAIGIPEEKIIILDKGRNTTENLRDMSNLADGKPSIVIATQRLAMVFKQSAEWQCNLNPIEFGMQNFDFDLFVIKQHVKETLHWYNFQIAGQGSVSLHFFASLVRRFEVYDKKFLLKPFEPKKLAKDAANLLESEFLIKQRLGGIKGIISKFQYIPIVWDIFWNAEKYVEEEELAIKQHKFN